MKKSKIKTYMKRHKVTISVIALLFIAKFLGFIKNVVLANYYGTGDISDAYQMAISIPTVTTGVLLLSYQAFTKGFFVSQKENDENRYTSSFINFVLVVAIIISILIVLFRENLLHFFAPGFDLVRIEYVSGFLLPIFIGVVAQIIANIMSEYLRAKKSYVPSQIAYLLINVIEIATIFLAFYINTQWLAYGYLLANIVYLLMLIILCYKNGYKYYLLINKRHTRLFNKIFIPVLISSLIVEINAMVDKIFASNFETGIVSTISYSVNIRSVLLIIAGGGLTVLFPKISKKSAEKSIDSFRSTIKRTAKLMTAIYIPITIVTILFAKEIVRLVYFRGEFNSESLISTTNCLIMYGIGMIGICIRDLLVKALYCLEKGKEIIIVSFLSVSLNIVLNIILSKLMGYAGLPLATSIAATISTIPLYFYYRKTIRGLIEDNNKSKEQ